jgi:hypothetical protein
MVWKTYKGEATAPPSLNISTVFIFFRLACLRWF